MVGTPSRLMPVKRASFALVPEAMLRSFALLREMSLQQARVTSIRRDIPDDHEMLKHGMIIHDALYTWCRSLQAESHGWPPKR
jgi:hypothetical protein